MHWLLVLAAENPSPTEAVNDPSDFQLILATIAVFVIFLNLMKKVAFAPVIKLLDERKAAIAGGLTGLDEERAALERLRADYEGHLTRIEAEGHQQTQALIAEAKREAQARLDAAREQYLADQARSQEELATELRRARDELRGQVASLALAATATALKRPAADAGLDLGQAERLLREALP